MRAKSISNISILLVLFLVLFAGKSFAIPSLQLNIADGHYVWADETIYAPAGNTFDLYAYLIPNTGNTLTDTYYIAAALVPMTGPTGGAFGTFTFGGGAPINVTGDMVYGVPPLETVLTELGQDPNDLPKHGIYETYYKEFSFTFGTDQVVPFNTQDQPGFLGTAGTGMYYKKFTVDLTGLAAGYGLHFDLYNTTLTNAGFAGDIDVLNLFAPFSHDAQSDGRVPEPRTMVLLGTGLIGLARWGQKRFR